MARPGKRSTLATMSPERPLGAHMSIAGGLAKAVDRAGQVEATALQIFTRNQVRWEAPPLDQAEALAFRDACTRSPLVFVCAHASYLINLASPDPVTRERSVDALSEELRRADALGCACLIMHPGSPKSDSRATGIARIVAGLRLVLERDADCSARIALENTAGQGATLGATVQDMADILGAVGQPDRLALCLDTCHAFASGIDLRSMAVLRTWLESIDAAVGLDKVMALHLNDSRKGLGENVDRHEQIGEGMIGERGFANLLSIERLRGVPGILETPKDDKTLEEDRRNLAILRRLQLNVGCQ